MELIFHGKSYTYLSSFLILFIATGSSIFFFTTRIDVLGARTGETYFNTLLLEYYIDCFIHSDIVRNTTFVLT